MRYEPVSIWVRFATHAESMKHTMVSVPRSVVAVTLWRGTELCLVRRSEAVGHDAGRWHCVTGYLEAETTPEEQALQELLEEVGLQHHSLLGLMPGGTLSLTDDGGGAWLVHTFSAHVGQLEVSLNWEHDDHCWINPRAGLPDDVVWWLSHVVVATLPIEPSRGTLTARGLGTTGPITSTPAPAPALGIAP